MLPNAVTGVGELRNPFAQFCFSILSKNDIYKPATFVLQTKLQIFLLSSVELSPENVNYVPYLCECYVIIVLFC